MSIIPAAGPRSTAKEIIDSFGTGQYLTGKTAIVTGGNSGIGLETCKALASAGCRVILCSRSVKAGEEAVKEEVMKEGNGGYVSSDKNIVVKALDLNSLSSIKTFADDVLQSEKKIDLLVLNAGIMALPNLERTDAGFERQIGVNHFGHFYLTRLLLGQIVKGEEGRVVVLSSTAHSMGNVDTSDLHFTNGRVYRPWTSYGQSKAANLLFAKSLADKLKVKNDKVTAVSVHPGVIQTNLFNKSFLNRLISWFIADKTIPQGAATTVYACVAPRISLPDMRGAYLRDCGPYPPSTSQCIDETGEERQKLWEVTEKQLGEALQQAGLPCLSCDI